MPTRKNSPNGLLSSTLADQLQRQIDAEAIMAGLNGEQVTSQEIRLRAAVSARRNFNKIPIANLERAISVLNHTEIKHIARREVAENRAYKKKFLIMIYPAELKRAKAEPEFMKTPPKEQSEWARNRAWASCQMKIEKKFGSPAPSEWSAEARQWAHKYNQS